MCFHWQDTSNTSNIVLVRTIQTSFVNSTGSCMGRAFLVSPHKFIKHGYACVDSGATHHMLNGEATNFMNYKTLPKGSHVLVADNHPIKCLGIGTQFLQINGRIIGRQQVLHVPALKAPLDICSSASTKSRMFFRGRQRRLLLNLCDLFNHCQRQHRLPSCLWNC
jgi:hypothetical protein